MSKTDNQIKNLSLNKVSYMNISNINEKNPTLNKLSFINKTNNYLNRKNLNKISTINNNNIQEKSPELNKISVLNKNQVKSSTLNKMSKTNFENFTSLKGIATKKYDIPKPQINLLGLKGIMKHQVHDQIEDKKQKEMKENFGNDLEEAGKIMEIMNHLHDKEKDTKDFWEKQRVTKLNHLLSIDRPQNYLKDKHKQLDYNVSPLKEISTRQSNIVQSHISQTPQPKSRMSKTFQSSFEDAYSPKTFSDVAGKSYVKFPPLNYQNLDENSVYLKSIPNIEKLATKSLNQEENQVYDRLEGRKKKKAKLERLLYKATTRLANLNLNSLNKQNHSPMGKSLVLEFKDIEQECIEVLHGFKEMVTDPVIGNWNGELEFFFNNFSKLIHLKDQVDIQDNSRDRTIKERGELISKVKDNITTTSDTPEPLFQPQRTNFKSAMKKKNGRPPLDDQMEQNIKDTKDEMAYIKTMNNKAFNSAVNIIFPDLSFEKQNVVKWWEWEMKHQIKFFENRMELFNQFMEYENNNKNHFNANLNIAKTFSKFTRNAKMKYKG